MIPITCCPWLFPFLWLNAVVLPSLSRVAQPCWVSSACVGGTGNYWAAHSPWDPRYPCPKEDSLNTYRTKFSPENSNISCKDLNLIASLLVKHQFPCSENRAFSSLFFTGEQRTSIHPLRGDSCPLLQWKAALYFQIINIFKGSQSLPLVLNLACSLAQRLQFLVLASPLHRC